MAGKKGSTQFAVSRRKMTARPAPWLPAICAAFAGLEPQLSNPDSAADFCEDQL
jgi:hypothetical protein